MRTERFKGALLSTLVIASLITPLLLLSPSPAHADPVVTSIKVEPSSATLTVGDSKYFYSIATYSDGENEYVTSVAQWTVNPPSAGSMYIVCWYSIEPPFCAASFHAENAGKATVTASYMGYSDNAEVTILAPHDPIYIVGNDNFTPSNGVVGGSGTENDPYTIEYWDISAENAHGIEIENTTAYFVIRNCAVKNGRGTYHYGIYFDNVVNGGAENCIVENNYYGIGLYSSCNNTLTNNTCENNYWYGIGLDDADNNTLTNNTCENNNWDGIDLGNSDNNTLTNNTCEDSYRGISLYYSNNNTLTNNTCENNCYGIYLGHFYSDNNLIYHNNFVNNATQARDNGTNYWDDGYPSGGNYWSDYTGEDYYRGENQDILGSDGIGDTQCYIPGDNNLDHYPSMNPFPLSWTGTAAFSLVNLYTVNVEKILDLNQGSKLVVKFYTYGDAFENENIIENFSPPWHVEENESARHPDSIGVRKARLDLTTDDTSNVISTVASFTVRKVDLEARFMEIPFYWSQADAAGKLDLEAEFMEIPFYWSGAPD